MIFEVIEGRSRHLGSRYSERRLEAASTPHVVRVEIRREVVILLNRYCQGRCQAEAGGILLGKRYDYCLCIDQATEPGPSDHSGRLFFERDPVTAQRAIDEAWRNSEGTRHYLGEWHTHPEPFPTPSHRDRKMIASMFEGTQPQYGPLLLLIVGTRDYWLGCQDQELVTYRQQAKGTL